MKIDIKPIHPVRCPGMYQLQRQYQEIYLLEQAEAEQRAIMYDKDWYPKMRVKLITKETEGK